MALLRHGKLVSAVTHSSSFSAAALSGEGKKFHTVGKTAFKGKWLG